MAVEVEFVTPYDREDPSLAALKECVRCGGTNGAAGFPAAVCSVDVKHVAAYSDMVRASFLLVIVKNLGTNEFRY